MGQCIRERCTEHLTKSGARQNQVTVISIASRCTEIYSPWITCIVSNNYSLYIDWVSKNEKQNLPPVVFSKKAVLKTFTVFTGKQMYWSLFLIKLQAFFKRYSSTGFFPVNVEKFLRTSILKNI